jgi:hypothetical protein
MKVYDALGHLACLYHELNKRAEEKALREEAYICVSEAYNPEHSLVLEAGGRLIECLILIKQEITMMQSASLKYAMIVSHVLL